MTANNKITLKNFTEQYTKLLNDSSKDELIAILSTMADSIDPKARQDFLNKLHPQKQKEKRLISSEVLDEIKGIKSQITTRAQEEPDWEFYDDENRLDGYEEFIEPLTRIVDKVEALFDYGHYMIARQAYEKLLPIFGTEDNYGHGIDLDDLQDIDQEETMARYLRSVYLTEKPETRAETLLKIMENIGNLCFPERPKLNDIVGISTEELPEFLSFLRNWISATQEMQKPQYDAWNREATILLDGLPGIEALAINEGIKRPRAYVDWIQVLLDENNYEAAINVAKDALRKLSGYKPIRATIADLMIFCGDKLNDKKIQFDGAWFSFEAKPDLLKLAKLYDQCEQNNIIPQMQLASEIIERQIKKSSKHHYERSWENDDLEIPSQPNANLLLHAYLLSNQDDKAFELAKKGEPLGWSSSDNPQAFFIAYFLVLSTKQSLEKLPNTLKKFWCYALDISSYHMFDYKRNEDELLQKVERIYHNLFLSPKAIDEEIIRWCLREAENRICAIVGNQHRGAYDRAAILTVACTETLGQTNSAKAIQFFNKIKSKFPRHSAFQSELKQITNVSR